MAVAVAGDFEALAKGGDARIFHLQAQRRTGRHAHDFLAVRFAARLGELGLQRQILRVLRLVTVEFGGDVGGFRDAGQDFRRRGRVERVMDVAGQPRKVETARAGVADVIQHRIGEAQLGFGERLAVACRAEIRDRIIRRLKTMRFDAVEIMDGRGRARAARSVFDPKRCEAAVAVKNFKRLTVVAAAHEAVEAARELFAQALGDARSAADSDSAIGACTRSLPVSFLISSALSCGSEAGSAAAASCAGAACVGVSASCFGASAGEAGAGVAAVASCFGSAAGSARWPFFLGNVGSRERRDVGRLGNGNQRLNFPIRRFRGGALEIGGGWRRYVRRLGLRDQLLNFGIRRLCEDDRRACFGTLGGSRCGFFVRRCRPIGIAHQHEADDDNARTSFPAM
jgi:hypothetical protein